jgi:hypothetical protein
MCRAIRPRFSMGYRAVSFSGVACAVLHFAPLAFVSQTLRGDLGWTFAPRAITTPALQTTSKETTRGPQPHAERRRTLLVVSAETPATPKIGRLSADKLTRLVVSVAVLALLVSLPEREPPASRFGRRRPDSVNGLLIRHPGIIPFAPVMRAKPTTRFGCTLCATFRLCVPGATLCASPSPL